MSNAQTITQKIAAGLARRHAAERRFRAYGIGSLLFAAVMLVVLLVAIIRPGINGFTRHELRLDISPSALTETTDYYALTQASLRATLPTPPLHTADRHKLYTMLGFFAANDVQHALASPRTGRDTGEAVSIWVPLSDIVDLTLKGTIDRTSDPLARPISDQQLGWLDVWENEGRIRRAFNWDFFISGDSRAPEAAGFGGAIVGSLLTLAVCLLFAVPTAIMAAITLEEFTKKNRIMEALEIIINNLAAVPSIIYGLLGLAVFLQLFGIPRSSPLIGGFTLALLILPVMIIAARAAIRAVPPSMRYAATALGATKLQTVRDHVLPYALPGIMTGTILSICRALGETAPLLMIGMVAFVADVPRGITDPSTAMPVAIYLWASSPEAGFLEKTSAGIMVLLIVLALLNLAAIRLRNRSEKVWS